MTINTGSKVKLLVTTALEKTWGEKQDILFIGEWCKPYKRQAVIRNRNHQTMPFHWSDRQKKIKDYEYIKSLNERILLELTKKLNKYHQVNKSQRYWRIILGPWLFFFTPMLWDRWENIRLAFENYDLDETIVVDFVRGESVPDDYDDLTYLSNHHTWNHIIFSYILTNYYQSQIKLKKVICDNKADIFNRLIRKKTSLKLKSMILIFVDSLLAFLQKKQKVAFFNSYFNFKTLLKIQFKLKQFPRLNSKYNKRFNYDRTFSVARGNKLNIDASNKFELFIEEYLFSMIPVAHLEGFQLLKNKVDSNAQSAQIIFSGISHLNNEWFKVWIAEQTEKNSKLLIMEHGGGLPYQLSPYADHEEKIADKKIVWHMETKPKQIKLSPSKLIRAPIKSGSHNDILLVAYDSSMYSYFVQTGPLSSSVLDDFNNVLKFINNLSAKALNDLKIRPLPYDYGWNCRARYQNILGKDKISSDKTLSEAYSNSKLIICTYPSTNFAEAFESNIPTVMIYFKELWEIQPEFDELISNLTRVNIIFSDPIKAAKHVNDISNSPEIWWNSSDVMSARKDFKVMCGDVSEDWLEEWSYFFNNELIK